MRVHYNIIMNKIHQKLQKDEFISPKNHLTPLTKAIYIALAVAKSTAERGNSNNLLVADNSTPFHRAFFVRGIRTPKENQTKIGLVILSMVGRNGQRLIVGCFPLVAVFHPVTLYRQAWKLAVDSQKLLVEFPAMLFKFLTGSRLKITIRANSEQEARQRLQLSDSAICIARYSNAFLAQKQTKMTACKGGSANAVHPQHPTTEQIHSLPTASGCGYDVCTTTYEGSRSRYTSGIFLPKIHQNHGLTTPVIHSEFAVRATPRNKADCIRTNKGGYSYVAVEPLSHPISDKLFSLTNTYDTMNKPTQTRKGIIAKLTAFPFVLSTEKGACYA